MKATAWEFRHRFWLFGAIFWIGFGLGAFDHRNITALALHSLVPGIPDDSPRELFWLHFLFAFGAALVFLAAWLRTWATSYLKAEVVHDMRQHAESIVAGGPYRHVRNPLYLANEFMALGLAFLASPAGWVLIVFGMWLFNYRLILREEEGLLNTQGEPFRRYMERVPRLLPSLRPRVPAGETQPSWLQGFAAESFVWMFAAAAACFAATLLWLSAAILLGLSFPVYFATVAFAKRFSTREVIR